VLPGVSMMTGQMGQVVLTQKTVFITTLGTSTYTIPADFYSLVSIECLGSGGDGASGNGITAGRGGKGGCYVKTTDLSGLSAGGSLFCKVGIPSNAFTWVNKTSSVKPASTADGIAAEGDANGTTSCVPTSSGGAFTVFAGGGDGGSGAAVAPGGGGAAGPNGAGSSGAAGGSGGAGGAGNAGAAGGGAGGTSGSAGSAGTYWTATAGGTAGPGGGGSGGPASTVGGAGGNYGAGGGGGSATGSKAGGAGSPGLIVFTYMASS